MNAHNAEKDVGRLGDLIAHHDAYHVNEDGWTVCICGHVTEGDDDDGSHARHVAAVILAAPTADPKSDNSEAGR